MQLDRLLDDTTQMPSGTSQRQKHIKLVELLNSNYPNDRVSLKRVEKWFERGSMPTAFLLRIAALRFPKLDLADYA